MNENQAVPRDQIQNKKLEERSVFRVGEKVPIKGYWFEVVSTNTHDVLLTVVGVSKAGRKMGYAITEKEKK